MYRDKHGRYSFYLTRMFDKKREEKMPENKFVKKRHIWIFILLVLMLHVVIYVMTDVKFNKNSVYKPNISVTVYTRWKQISASFQRFYEHIYPIETKMDKQSTNLITDTTDFEREPDITMVVDR